MKELGDEVDFQQPPPKGWDQFEDLCADIFQLEWQDPMLVRHGRAGQPQHGVDIVGRHGAEWPVAVQCKNKSVWPVKRLTATELDEEVEKAKGFKPALKAFYLVSTAPDDEALQAHARKITAEHLVQGLFPVAVFGWGELERRAKRHKSVAARHFGAYSHGPVTPLLANWRAEKRALHMTDAELAVSIRELIHDLRAFPAGRIGFRRKEAEDLQLQIQILQAESKGSVEERNAIVDLRDALKVLEDSERRVTTGLSVLLGSDPLRDYMRLVWTDHATTIVRAFVEQEIDPDHSVVTGFEKIRLHPPNDPEDYIAVFVPPAAISALWNHANELRRRFPNLKTDSIGEMEPSIQFGFAVPAVLSRLVSRLSGDASLKELERKKWLDMPAWKVTF